MKRARAALAICAGMLLAAGPAFGEDLNEFIQQGDEPITIDASEGIEWRQDDQVYVARGNAKAIRGDVSVAADLLQARYRKGEDDKNQIWQVEALGNVVIVSRGDKVYGDKGIYNIDSGVFELTGKDLRIVGEDQVVTARDKIEYRRNEQIARALGNATATKGDKSLRADSLTAHFGEDPTGKTRLERIEATGDVIVTTPTEVAQAKRADYDAVKEFVTLSGDVKLNRGPNQLNGEYAEVDLAKGVSRLLARPRGASGGKPVHGLFIPGEDGGEASDLGDILGGPDSKGQKPKTGE